jgi:hypothetical protein
MRKIDRCLFSCGAAASPLFACVSPVVLSQFGWRARGMEGARLERMQAAVRCLLTGLGEDVGREGLVDTPKVGRGRPR